MDNTTVCFTGHRLQKLPYSGDESRIEVSQIKERLHHTILESIHNGCSLFVTGMALGFDVWAGEAVADLRDSTYGEIRLEAAIPFPGQSGRFNTREKERYEKLLARVDKRTMVSENYTRECFHVRNRYMVDKAGLLICYYDGLEGGTAYTWGYARKRGLTIINIARNGGEKV